MKMSLRRKLSLSYVFVAMVCVFLISFLSNTFLEKQFENYVIKVTEQKSKGIVTAVANQYNSKDKWNYYVIESIGIDALAKGFIIKVEDISENVVWDATIYNNGRCESILTHMAQNMKNQYRNWQGEYIQKQYNINSDSRKVGVIKIGYYGPFYYDDNDVIFLNTLNKIILIVGLVSMIISLILGIIIASGVSKPISKVISTAENISRGNYNDRLSEESNIKEISTLTTSINNLAYTLKEQEKLRKRLSADVSHELRTPLSTLQSHMEAIIDGVWDPTIDRIKSCHEEIIRISRLVGDLEKLSKYESENLILNKSEFDVGETIKNIILNFENECLNKNIKIFFKYKEEIIFADKDKIAQVGINIISNALKYTQHGGRIDINIKEVEQNMELVIKDNGMGIPKEDIPYIFERFYRADKSRNRLTGGAGIGLSITKSIIEAHKGIITVESKLNEGTEFKVMLPRVFVK